MSGLRIHHPELRSVVLLVPHPGDAATGRKPKDYRITIDADGDAIVSERVWQRLEEARASGLAPHRFFVLNVVEDPPTILTGGRGSRGIQLREALRQTPDGVATANELAAAQAVAPPGVRMGVKEA